MGFLAWRSTEVGGIGISGVLMLPGPQQIRSAGCRTVYCRKYLQVVVVVILYSFALDAVGRSAS